MPAMARPVSSLASSSSCCFALVGCLSILAFAAPAGAEPILQPSASGLLLIADSSVVGGGAGTLMVGYNTENEPILIVPHLAGSFGYYGGAFSGIYARAMVGMKFGAALSVEPSFITRGGYGYNQVVTDLVDAGAHGVAFQSGPALDYRISRETSVGGELLYDVFIHPDSGSVAHAVLLGISFGFAL